MSGFTLLWVSIYLFYYNLLKLFSSEFFAEYFALPELARVPPVLSEPGLPSLLPPLHVLPVLLLVQVLEDTWWIFCQKWEKRRCLGWKIAGKCEVVTFEFHQELKLPDLDIFHPFSAQFFIIT